jgi:hypothetical protein
MHSQTKESLLLIKFDGLGPTHRDGLDTVYINRQEWNMILIIH